MSLGNISCSPTLDIESQEEIEKNQKLIGNKYSVGGVVGVGTYGEVRYGINIETGERCALKIIDLHRFNPETATLMKKEIKILKMINHENCIRILDVRESVPYSGQWCENCACSSYRRVSHGVCGHCAHSEADHSDTQHRNVMLIVQELALGGELFGLLMHTGPFDEDIARYYFRQLMNGLEHIHSQNISHRDLKPENLCFDSSFTLKIVDFGLASLGNQSDGASPTDDHQPTATSPPEIDSNPNTLNMRQTPVIPNDGVVHHSGVGSQPYASPECYYVKELYGGKAYKGAPADIWSCAVILFVMMTGRPPFVRPLAKTFGVGAHLKKCRHFINVIGGDGLDVVSPDAKDLLRSMFQLAPDSRPSIQTILAHPWMQGSVPPKEVLHKIMEDKAKRVWAELDKPDLLGILAKMRKKEEMLPSTGYTPINSPSQSPFASPSQSPSLGPQRSPSMSGMDTLPSIPPSPGGLSQSPTPVPPTPPFSPSPFTQTVPDEIQSTSAAVPIDRFNPESNVANSTALFSLSASNSAFSTTPVSRSLRSHELEAREMAEKLRGERSGIFGTSPVNTTSIFSTLQSPENQDAPVTSVPSSVSPIPGVNSGKSSGLLKKTFSSHSPSSSQDFNNLTPTSAKKTSARKMHKPKTRLPPAPRLSHTNSHPPRCHVPQYHGYTRFLSALPFNALLSVLQGKLEAQGLTNGIEVLKAGREWSLFVVGSYQSTTLACQIRISKIKSKESSRQNSIVQAERGTILTPYSSSPVINSTSSFTNNDGDKAKFLIDIHKIKAPDSLMFHTFVEEMAKDLRE